MKNKHFKINIIVCTILTFFTILTFTILCHYGEIVQSMIGTEKFHDPPFGEFADALHNQDICLAIFLGFLTATIFAFFIPMFFVKEKPTIEGF